MVDGEKRERNQRNGFIMEQKKRIMKRFTHHPYLFITSISLSFFFLFIIIHPHSFFNLPSSHFQHRKLHQQMPYFSSGRVLLAMEEKARLGSTPPSCYNKCNSCHPCLAVQVPSMPVSLRAKRPRPSSPSSVVPTEYFDPSPETGRYSNYKPLGWKCRCRNHLFNP